MQIRKANSHKLPACPIYDYFPSYLPQIHINDVGKWGTFQLCCFLSLLCAGSRSNGSSKLQPHSQGRCHSSTEAQLLLLFLAPELLHWRILKIAAFLLKTFILCFSAIASECWSGSTSFQKQQINRNQTCLVLFLFRKLFRMHSGTRLKSQFCKNGFKWNYCCGKLHSFKTNYTWLTFPLVKMIRHNWAPCIFPVNTTNFL